LEYSEGAKVYCLIHKMDLIKEEESKEKVFKEKEEELRSVSKAKITCFATSIWDETLYQAWSSIVYSLIPNIHKIERNLNDFTKICGADEVVLFEKASFLVIASASKKEHSDIHRFEKISNIVKQFKLSCK
jgi:Ras-related GTP-binding protein A/B